MTGDLIVRNGTAVDGFSAVRFLGDLMLFDADSVKPCASCLPA